MALIPPMTPFLLLIDDHPLFRSGLRLVLERDLPGIGIIEAGTLAEALAHQGTPPSLLLLDIQLPGLNGLNGLALLQKQWPAVPVIVLSSQTDPATVRRALASGASAFIPKTDSPERIIHATQCALAGTLKVATLSAPPAAASRLTARQLQVLELLCQGLSNKLIGRQMGLSENTVRGHVQAILSCLGVCSRSEAMFVAQRDRLVG